jgi:hypothetical protein
MLFGCFMKKLIITKLEQCKVLNFNRNAKNNDSMKITFAFHHPKTTT